MAVPTLVAVGTEQGSASAVTPGMPSGVLAGDILLCFCMNATGSAASLSGGTETWTEISDSPCIVSGQRALAIFWARASQDSPTSPTTNDVGAQNFAVIAAFRGCIASGSPIDVTSKDTDTVSDTSVSVPGDTTTVPNCLIVAASGHGGTNDYVSGSSWANADLANVVAAGIINVFTSVSSDSSLIVTTGEKVAAGAYGSTTCTIAVASNDKCLLNLALKPAPSSARPPNRYINQSVNRASTY